MLTQGLEAVTTEKEHEAIGCLAQAQASAAPANVTISAHALPAHCGTDVYVLCLLADQTAR